MSVFSRQLDVFISSIHKGENDFEAQKLTENHERDCRGHSVESRYIEPLLHVTGHRCVEHVGTVTAAILVDLWIRGIMQL